MSNTSYEIIDWIYRYKMREFLSRLELVEYGEL